MANKVYQIVLCTVVVFLFLLATWQIFDVREYRRGLDEYKKESDWFCELSDEWHKELSLEWERFAMDFKHEALDWKMKYNELYTAANLGIVDNGSHLKFVRKK